MSPPSRPTNLSRLALAGAVALGRNRMRGLTDDACVKVAGHHLMCGDRSRAIGLVREVFVGRHYEPLVPVRGDRPRIIDAGANIGVSILYFKMRYPNARITAFEPEPHNAELLAANIDRNRLAGVDIVAAALTASREHVTLYSKGVGDIGVSVDREYRLHFHAETELNAIDVPAVPLSRYLDEELDLLKLDVEGAELEILEECATQLTRVARIVMECHVYPSSSHALPRVLDLLTDAQHQYAIDRWEVDPRSPGVATCRIRTVNTRTVSWPRTGP